LLHSTQRRHAVVVHTVSQSVNSFSIPIRPIQAARMAARVDIGFTNSQSVSTCPRPRTLYAERCEVTQVCMRCVQAQYSVRIRYIQYIPCIVKSPKVGKSLLVPHHVFGLGGLETTAPRPSSEGTWAGAGQDAQPC
jgi:hypothetical protein